jgi:hypothetical protein
MYNQNDMGYQPVQNNQKSQGFSGYQPGMPITNMAIPNDGRGSSLSQMNQANNIVMASLYGSDSSIGSNGVQNNQTQQYGTQQVQQHNPNSSNAVIERAANVLLEQESRRIANESIPSFLRDANFGSNNNVNNSNSSSVSNVQTNNVQSVNNMFNDQVAKAGLGVSTAIGIGGDPIIGTSTKQAVEMLMNDPETDAIIMIGEIGGNYEA